MKAYIFDLDGVIVDTAKYHFLAWKKIGEEELNFSLTLELNEQLKGVSREDSFRKILTWAGVSLSEEKFTELATRKNEEYLQFISQITENEILTGVKDFIIQARSEGKKIALASASKNARFILEKLKITSFFDVIVDGNDVKRAKPDPEIFLISAEKLGVSPLECVVFEDSEAGIEAAKTAKMKAIGIGSATVLNQADVVYENFEKLIKIKYFFKNTNL